jgi:hypothetical protein
MRCSQFHEGFKFSANRTPSELCNPLSKTHHDQRPLIGFKFQVSSFKVII